MLMFVRCASMSRNLCILFLVILNISTSDANNYASVDPKYITGHHGIGNFRAGNHHWNRLGQHRTQRDTMDFVTFELGITTGTLLGGNGRQWIW